MSDLAKKARKYNPPLREKLAGSEDPKEELRAQEALEKFVTNPQGSIYALTSYVPELFAALLPARYSRTELSAKQLLWREFVSSKNKISWNKIDQGKKALDEVFNFTKAESVAERILIQYGDDSVFELGGLHLFVDRVSQLGVKAIEDARIGISPLEKSTRYVVFDQKDESGDYSFFKDPQVMESEHKDLYLQLNRSYFDFYSECLPLLEQYYKEQIPIDLQEFDDFISGKKVLFKNLKDEKSIKAARSAYTRSIRSKACDIARVILPTSTFTNVGLFGNARSFGYLFTRLGASNLAECQMVSEEGVKESKKVLPKFFDNVDSKRGQEYQEYLRKTDELMSKLARSLLKGVERVEVPDVDLVKMSSDPEVNIVAALLYPYTNLPLRQLVNIASKMSEKQRGDILRDSLKFRKDRRHKPPRAYEIAGYELVFDILGNYGGFRDLHRHRILTQQRQKIGMEHGFDLPEEFAVIGKAEDYRKLMKTAAKGYKKIAKNFPNEAQYTVPMAYKMRWYMGMNLREGFWLTELRSVPQGHFHYRTIAQKMYQVAQKRYPFLKNLGFKAEQYVNMEDYSHNLERMEAMQRIEKKLAEVEEKYSK